MGKVLDEVTRLLAKGQVIFKQSALYALIK